MVAITVFTNIKKESKISFLIYKIILFLSLCIYSHANQNQLKLYHTQSTNGDINATYQLGLIYYNGKIVKKDLDKAFFYFNIASDYGNQKAKFNKAMIFSQKKFKNHSAEDAYALFEELAKQNHTRSQYMVGYMLLKGIGVKANPKEALKWFEYSYFENNHIPSSCMIAIIYANGFGTMQNLGRANDLAKVGIKHNLKLCKYITKEFKLYNYPEDKGFKFGYYSIFK